jgi:N-acetylmuramoyl-L-alanine amidase
MRSIKNWVAFLLLLAPAAPAAEKRISVYSPQTSYSLPVLEREGRDYVGLLEVLEPLGNVGAIPNGKKWKLRFNQADAEFTDGKTRAKIRGRDLDLAAPFRLENGRGLVPSSSLSALLAQITASSNISFHEAARRLFVGNVSVRYTAELTKGPPPQLTLTFTSAVNPTVATEPGKVHLTFAREPLQAGSTTSTTFDDKSITALSYLENNGAAELLVTTSVPLLATFRNEGRTVTLSPAPRGQGQPGTAGVPSTTPSPGTTPAGGTASATGPGAYHRYFAIVDASHGGSDRGAALSATLAEKDINLAFARRLAKEFESNGVSALVLRDSDAAITLEQRAALINDSPPVIYIAVHSTSSGAGVRVYSALLPAGPDARGPFRPWETAQAPFLKISQAAAGSIVTELQRHDIPAKALAAPLAPLHHVIAPAIALEIAPTTGDLNDLNSTTYQDAVATAVAATLLASRGQLENAR